MRRGVVMAGNRPTQGRVWDPLLRLTHWGVAVAVLVNGLILTDASQAHILIGYTALGLLALRLVWGLIGPVEARFSSFPPSIGAALGHVRALVTGRHPSYPSHNPLGSLMVYALWGTLIVVSLTGVMLAPAPFPEAGAGAVSLLAEIEAEEEGLIGEVHEAAANLLLLLAALHVAGVALESRLSGVNLARGMITGHERGRAAGRG